MARRDGQLPKYVRPIAEPDVRLPKVVDVRLSWLFETAMAVGVLAATVTVVGLIPEGDLVLVATGGAAGVLAGLPVGVARGRRVLARTGEARFTAAVMRRGQKAYNVFGALGCVVFAYFVGLVSGILLSLLPGPVSAVLVVGPGVLAGTAVVSSIMLLRWERRAGLRVSGSGPRRKRWSQVVVSWPPRRVAAIARGAAFTDGEAAVVVALATTAHFSGRFLLSAALSARLFERFGHPEFAYNRSCSLARAGRPQVALDALEEAAAAGWSRVDDLDHDKDLESLRHRSRFRTIRDAVQVNATAGKESG